MSNLSYVVDGKRVVLDRSGMVYCLNCQKFADYVPEIDDNKKQEGSNE